MGFANKMSESIIAERLYWCSRNAILFANCSQNKETSQGLNLGPPDYESVALTN